MHAAPTTEGVKRGVISWSPLFIRPVAPRAHQARDDGSGLASREAIALDAMNQPTVSRHLLDQILERC